MPSLPPKDSPPRDSTGHGFSWNRHLRIAFFVILLAGPWGVPLGAVDPAEIPSGPGCLLLGNGAVLSGKLKVLGDQIEVQIDANARVTVRASEVRCVGKEIRELYEFQRARTPRMGPGEHLHFATWCIDNGLLEEAEEHYQALERKIPGHPKLRLLEARYRARLLKDPVTRSAFSLPPNPSQVVVAGATESSAAGMDRQVEELSRQPLIANGYRDIVLPLMRNRCGSSGCHGNQTRTTILFPPAASQSFKSFQSSLTAVLHYLRSQPEGTEAFIAKATSIHASQKIPAIDPSHAADRVHVESLSRWMATVQQAIDTQNATGVQTATDRQSSAAAMPPVQTAIGSGPSGGSVTTAQWQTATPPSSESPTLVDPESEWRKLEGWIRQLEEKERQMGTGDPFDPQQFNQQFAGRPSDPGKDR